MDHETRGILAYVLADHKDAVFLALISFLSAFDITQFYADYWEAYSSFFKPDVHTVGKANTQQTKREHLTLCTRIKFLAHKIICLSNLD
ncbi:hypothetical protein IQ266_23695 [filamentous cyanobacterium LEGE 11480]|uniref:Transposase n=1 Tax=Romeriopsis navalis LEGE 11480 TaxID=2777977 RepID=A0A928VQP3_9CYAN|nr:hypothetical protein [Romeriopsis navalis LEGE 11480]